MNVLADTSVWFSALCRDRLRASDAALELGRLISGQRVAMIGPIRQELLSGLRSEEQFRKLAIRLAAFPDLPLETNDYLVAASYYNRCRARGVQGSNTDFLICAVATRLHLSIFTKDNDFHLFAKHLPIDIYRPGETQGARS